MILQAFLPSDDWVVLSLGRIVDPPHVYVVSPGPGCTVELQRTFVDPWFNQWESWIPGAVSVYTVREADLRAHSIRARRTAGTDITSFFGVV